MKPATSSISPVDLAVIRSKLAQTHGRTYWRSLEELAGTPEFKSFLEREFPANAWQMKNEVTRRQFLSLMAASFALAGLTACTRQPIEKIVPYIQQPEELVPGKPLFFATAQTLGGFASGLLVESHDGHPTKAEGNPWHPDSLGATSIFGQAALLDLYDPDRSQAMVKQGEVSSWNLFLADLQAALDQQNSKQGAGLRLLTETVTSPTLHAEIEQLLRKFPQAQWIQYRAHPPRQRAPRRADGL